MARSRLIVLVLIALIVVTASTALTSNVARGSTAGVSRTAKELLSRDGIAVDAQTSRVFLVDLAYSDRGQSGIAVLDARTDRLLRVTPVGAWPRDIVVAERTGRVFVLNEGSSQAVSGTVGVLDARSGRLVRTVKVDSVPVEAAVDGVTGRVFVATVGDTGNGYAAIVDVLDASSGRLLRHVFVGNSPTAVAVDERSGRVFVAGYYDVAILDGATGRLLDTIVAGNHPVEALVDSASGRVYLVDVNGRMDVLDARSGRALETIMPPEIGGMPGATLVAAVDERFGRVLTGGIGTLYDDTTAVGGLSILAASSDRLVRTLALRMQPEAIAVSPDGRQALVLEASSAESGGTSVVDVVDVPHARLVRTVPLGAYAAAIAVDGATGRAYVAGPRFVRMLDAFHGAALGPIASLP